MNTPTRKTPTSEEVLARQAADHASKPRPAPANPTPAAGNGGTAVAVKTNVPANPDTSGLPAVPDTRTNVEKYLDEFIPAPMLVGRGIKFSKEGKPVYMDTGEDVSPDTDFIAHCDQVAIAWVKFHKDAPPDVIGGLPYGGFVMPPRNTLGDLDPAEWPIGLSGQPDDPWKHQMYLPLQRADSKEMATYIAGSRTGRNAMGALLRHYERMRKSHQNEYPVIRVKVGGFNHKDERIGWVAVPTFVVVGRTPADSAARPDTSLAAGLDDNIPDFA